MLENNAWRYDHFTHAYHKWQLYDVRFLRYGEWWTEYFVILDNLLPFYLPRNLKKSKFWKNIKKPGDTIILNKCTKKHDHMLYCSWDMVHDISNLYFSFWAIICPFFTSITAWKMKISKKWKKKVWRCHNFTQITKNYDHTVYCYWDMAHDGNYFSFWAISCPFGPYLAPKIKISKEIKKTLKMSFYTSASKIMIRWCTVPELWCVTDGWTDGWKKRHRGRCPT